MEGKKGKKRRSFLRILGFTPKTPREEPEEDGGVIDNTYRHAPTVIGSTQMVFFDCWVSTMDIPHPEETGNHIFQFSARLENGAVKGQYRVLDTGENRVFRESHRFMATLLQWVNKYDLAQYNGVHLHTRGLPPDYGVTFTARYASGETLSFSNNQDNYLPLKAVEELIDLFQKGVPIP